MDPLDKIFPRVPLFILQMYGKEEEEEKIPPKKKRTRRGGPAPPSTQIPKIMNLKKEYNDYTYIKNSDIIRDRFEGNPEVPGLFASKDFVEGDIVATYGGKLVSVNEMKEKSSERKTHSAKIEFGFRDKFHNEWIIDAKEITPKNVISEYNNQKGSFANSASELGVPHNVNFEWREDEDNRKLISKLSWERAGEIKHKGFYALVANKPIKKDTEILLKYEFKKYLHLK